MLNKEVNYPNTVPKISKITDADRVMGILEFVRNNPNCTKADVVRHMQGHPKGRSSIITTHAILSRLIEEESKINMFMENIQSHLLTINDENEFNKIYNSFSEIEEMIEKLINVGRKTLPLDVLIRLVSTYIVSSKALIDYLLIRINTKNHSEKDAFILNKKAINLMGKIDNLPYYSHNWTDEINQRIRFVEHAKSSLKEEFEQVPADFNEWFDIMIDELKKFKKEFLSETKQKTKKP